MTVEWIDDKKAEDVLNGLGLSWSVETISADDINWKESEKNVGRVGFAGSPFSSSMVEDYYEAMMRGDRFPMVVLAKTPKGIIVVAGRHRTLAALRAGVKEFVCYFYEALLEHEVRLVAIGTNRKEGARVDQDEAMEYAVSLVFTTSLSPKDVAEHVGINLVSLNRRILSERRRRQLAAAGHSAEGLSDNVVRTLGRISHNIKVMSRVADLAKLYFPSNDRRVRDIVNEVLQFQTEDAQMTQLAKVAKRLEAEFTTPAKRAQVALPVRTKFVRALAMLKSVTQDKSSLEDLQIASGSEDHQLLKSEWDSLKEQIDGLL